MGWGIKADVRDELLRPAQQLLDSAACTTPLAVFDGNAVCRSEAVGGSPPAAVAARVLERCGAAASVLICFDDGRRAPPLRAEVAVKRAARACPGASPEAVAAVRADKPLPDGVTWEMLFATAPGKRRALAVLYRALQRGIVIAATPERCPTFTMTPPGGGEPWVHPFDAESEFAAALGAQRYGEAEAQLVCCLRDRAAEHVAAGREVPGATVYTIDTDIYLQLMGVWARNVTVVIAKMWRCSDDTVHRTKRAAIEHDKADASKRPRKRQRVWRAHRFNALSALFGNGAALALSNAQLWLLFAGGVDYCGGLGRYGWNQTTCLDNAQHCVVRVASDGAHVLRLDKLARRLAGCRNARRADRDVAGFCAELCRALYCWRYYSWGAEHAAVGGPEHDAGELLPGDHATVAEWLAAVPRGVAVPVAARPMPAGPAHALDADALNAYTVYPDAARHRERANHGRSR